MICQNCNKNILDNSRVCPFCGKNPNKKIQVSNSKAQKSMQFNYPLAFMLVFVILGILTIGITLLVHRVLIGNSFSMNTIMKYCTTPLGIGIALIVIGILIKVVSIPAVNKLIKKITARPTFAIALGIILLVVGVYLAYDGFSYQESEQSKNARAVSNYIGVHGTAEDMKWKEKIDSGIDRSAGAHVLEGIGGIVVGLIGFAIMKSGVKKKKEA